VTSALLVAGGGFQALPMLRGLRRARARVIIADCYEQNPNRYSADAYAVVPRVDRGEEFERAILGLCERHGVKIVFATTDHDALAVATLAPRLRARGIITAVPDAHLLRAWTDKVVCLREAAAAGLPVLPMVEPGQVGCDYPVIGKPRRGWGGRGHVIARSAAEAAEAAGSDSHHSLFWQPFLDSCEEWSVDFAVRESGEISPLVARQRLRSSGGFAVVSRVRRDTPVAELAERAAGAMARRGGCGPMNLQILVDSGGSPWLNDVNLRPGTSATAALAAGVNFASFMLNQPARFAERGDFLHVRTLRDDVIPLPLEGPIEGVAFDLDDCLIAQKAWMDQKLSLVLAGLRDGPQSEVDRRRFELEAQRVIDEGPWDRTIDLALSRAGLEARLRQPLIDAWRAAHPDRVSFHDDAAAAWRSLRRAGLKLAIVSDNPQAGQRQKLARFPDELRPDAVVLTDEIGRPKPAPDGFRLAAKRLGVPVERMIAIGDSPWRDAVGAIDAGYAAAIVAPRRGAMGNPDRERFERAYPAQARGTRWLRDLWAVPELLPGDRVS
jgi:FMN phosphatase YigB (HAD superfamily)/glutathione synthase/RimK-type ligase-like ATP-grasp enzyme